MSHATLTNTTMTCITLTYTNDMHHTDMHHTDIHHPRTYTTHTGMQLVGEKVGFALSVGLSVVPCVGEKLEERESNHTNDVISRQLAAIVGAGMQLLERAARQQATSRTGARW